MNVVFLSPHFPPGWFRFCAALREVGANVLGLADAPWESLRPELRAALAEYYRVSDMEDYGQLLRALGYFTHRHGKIGRLDSLNEHWLEKEAALRDDFNIPGLRTADMPRVRRKSEMKRVFQDVGLAVARGWVCRTLEAARALADEVGFPLVAKPDAGVGAARTFRVEDPAGLVRWAAEKAPVDYILEEFLTGPIVTYDGLADREGRVVFESTMQYSAGVMESVNERRDIWYWMPRVIPEDLRAAGLSLVRAFGVRERPFHFEFFRLPDGGLAALEVNMRVPGGLTVDMFNYANDIDFHLEWARVLVHGRFEAEARHPFACAYVGRRDGRAYALPHQEILRRFGGLVVHWERMEGVFAPAIGDSGYLLRHPDLAAVEAAALAIHARA
ncbi:MAG TPA: carboxylate--amine ligase [Anaeromyxobacteraceae bacterium]|nr:carboxylate--amine ligase [Anaeromyxobacteraceae bacterium]